MLAYYNFHLNGCWHYHRPMRSRVCRCCWHRWQRFAIASAPASTLNERARAHAGGGMKKGKHFFEHADSVRTCAYTAAPYERDERLAKAFVRVPLKRPPLPRIPRRIVCLPEPARASSAFHIETKMCACVKYALVLRRS